MHTTHTGVLESQIEELVRAEVAAIRRAVAAAVERGLRQVSSAAPKVRSGTASSASKRAVGPRRAPSELAGLAERLYAAIRANPGAGMSVLAAQIGATPRELNQPAKHLREAGRVRSVGQRSATRYFPMVSKTAARS
jgi:hypothetical protein